MKKLTKVIKKKTSLRTKEIEDFRGFENEKHFQTISNDKTQLTKKYQFRKSVMIK